MFSRNREPWSNVEDARLMQLVQMQEPLNWVRIAQRVGSRSPKQCRGRYHQYLKPTLNHDPITPEEGAQIEFLVVEIGKRWTEIARRLRGRSENAVKNWWNNSQSKRKRLNGRCTTHRIGPSDEYYSLSMSVQGQSLPLPRPNSMQSAIDYHTRWPDAPVRSPCSSESPDTEPCADCKTSPRRIPALRRRAVELRPGLPFPQQTTQLPTTPNSRVPHQQSSPTKDRDSRMNISSLLE